MNEAIDVIVEAVNWLQDEINIIDDKLEAKEHDGMCGSMLLRERKITMLETILKLAELANN